jgi:dipeptidase
MCDTIVATAEATRDGSVILAKNSDREPNEAQCIEYHPGKTFAEGEKVRCTYISIPQVKKTRAILISRPFWMWGAEMGANERGVVIGNEAVFTKLPMSLEKRLIGMDLIRLALERADKAKQALTIITELIEEFGQGGPCGYEDKKLAYHNSFIIADPKEAWVLETADKFWVAQKVKGIRSISNGLTIGRDFDMASPGVVEHAIEKGWCKSERDFHFARCYSDWFFTTFSMCARRQGRTMKLLAERAGGIDVSTMMEFLRDHGEDKKDFSPDRGFFMTNVCMHAANGLSRNSHSTGSIVSHLTGGIATHWVSGTSTPCTALFKPFYFEAKELPDVGPEPSGIYDEKALWWRHEALQRAVHIDYPTRSEVFLEKRDELEKSFISKSNELVGTLKKAAQTEKKKALQRFSRECFKKGTEALAQWKAAVLRTPVRKRASALYMGYWKKQNRKANVPL